MSLLPPSTNADYRGARVSAWFLMFIGVTTVAPGLIHFFLPDGGAHVIAGIDMGDRAHTIIAVFAWFGALQIPHGIAEIVVGWRYRPLTPLFLALVLVERGLMAVDGWFLKGAGAHHPPEHYGSVGVVILTSVFLFLALRPGNGGRPAANP